MPSKNEVILSSVVGALAAALEFFIGGFDEKIIILVVLMCVDFVMGILIAMLWGKSKKSKYGGLSSNCCWQGIVKKICTIFLVAVAYQIDKLIGMTIIRSAVIVAFCVSEIISICENAAIMGILPEQVKNIFEKAIDILKGDNKNGKQ